MIPYHPFSVAATLLNASVEIYPLDVNIRYINLLRAEQNEFVPVGSALISSGNGLVSNDTGPNMKCLL